jgi:adenylate cyclase
MDAKKSWTQIRDAGRTLLLGIIVIGVVLVINSRDPAPIEFAELKASDLRMRPAHPGPKTNLVAIAAIDDASIAVVGHWPWPRDHVARLITALSDYKVAVMGMDVLFTEPDDFDRDHRAIALKLGTRGISESVIADSLGPGNDADLAEALRQQGSTFLAYAFESHRFGASPPSAVPAGFTTKLLNPPPIAFDPVLQAPGPLPDLIDARAYQPPIPLLNSAARGTAFVDADSDSDGVLRALPTVVRFHNRFCMPLFLVLVSSYRSYAPQVLSLTKSGVGGVMIGSVHVPVDEMGRMLISFRGSPGTFPRYSVADIMMHRVPAADLKGKVVLVGMTAHGLGDRVTTPAGGDFPGVEVQANAIDNLLNGDVVRRSMVTEGESRLAAVVMGLAISLAVGWLGASAAGAATIVLVTSFLLYAQYRLAMDGVLIGVVLPVFTALTVYALVTSYRYITEGLERRRLRGAFVHYLAPTLVDKLAEDSAALKLGGEERHISVMFADLTGFTVASTEMSPEALTSKVNRYFSQIVAPVDATGGYVERFLGDSVLALWGAPLSDAKHAVNAVRAAMSIIENVRRAFEEDAAGGVQGFTIKVGINSGRAVVGNIGSKDRYSYTAMGEDVNLAARLESLPPLYGCSIIVGEHTARIASNDFLMREVDLVLVKGAARPMAIYQPLAELGKVTDRQREIVARYADALRHYRAKCFTEAIATWDELTAAYEPAPSPSSIMSARAKEFVAHTPPPHWDGVQVFTTK